MLTLQMVKLQSTMLLDITEKQHAEDGSYNFASWHTAIRSFIQKRQSGKWQYNVEHEDFPQICC